MSRGATMLHAVTRVVGRLPLGMLRMVGKVLGLLAYGLHADRRRITIDNIRQAYPEQDMAWVRRLARASFMHLGQVGMECMRLSRLDAQDVMSRVRIHGQENFQAAKDRGRGVVMLSLHLSSWEWMLPSFALKIEPTCAIYQPLKFSPADHLVRGWRSMGGNVLLPRAHSLKAMLKHLRNQGTVGIIFDQGADWYEGVWVKYFGRDACTSKGLTRLVGATGAAVVPAYITRAPNGMFDLNLLPEVPRASSSSRLHDDWQNTQNYTRVLEDIVRAHPEQWFWQHRRWKFLNYCPWPREDR